MTFSIATANRTKNAGVQSLNFQPIDLKCWLKNIRDAFALIVLKNSLRKILALNKPHTQIE